MKEHPHTTKAKVALDKAKKKLAIAEAKLEKAEKERNEAKEVFYQAEYEVRIQQSIDLDRK